MQHFDKLSHQLVIELVEMTKGASTSSATDFDKLSAHVLFLPVVEPVETKIK